MTITLENSSRGELSDEEAVECLKNIISSPNFEQLTMDTIDVILANYAGIHGMEAQDLAEQFLKDLLKWGKLDTPPKNSCTRHGDCWHIQAFPDLDSLEQVYLNMKNYPNLKITDGEIIQRRKAIWEENFIGQFYL